MQLLRVKFDGNLFEEESVFLHTLFSMWKLLHGCLCLEEITILLSKIEFIIYHKEKGRLNILDGLCFEASISYRSVSNVDQESQYGYCGSSGGSH